MSRTASRTTLYALFFLSGGAALGCQIAWAKMFTTGLGHEMPAALAVVCAFLGGMALGAAMLDRAIGRSPEPGRWYAWLEILIAAWVCCSVVIIPQVNEVAVKLTGVDPSPWRQWLIAFGLPFLTLLPATTAMGATLPAMERFVSPLIPDGRCLGALYAANTFGAVTGVLTSSFLIVPTLGLSRSICLLGQFNLLCGIVALFLGARSSPAAAALNASASLDNASSTTQYPHPAAGDSRAPFPTARLMFTVFLTGLLGIGYEVVGVRVLSQVLENTIYTYANALAIFLLATSLGAAAYQRWWRNANARELLSVLLGLLSQSCLLGVFLLSFSPKIYESGRGLFGGSFVGALTAEMATAATIFALPALFMGATFSLLLQLSRRPEGGVGRAAAWNTLGGAIAPALFGVGLLPLIQGKGAVVVIALAYLALLPGIAGWRWMLPAVAVGLVLAGSANLQFVPIPAGGAIRDYREGVMASVVVIEDAAGQRTLRVNNRFQMGGTAAAGKEHLQAHIPLLLHPDPKRALFLGTGTGITLGAATLYPNLQSDGVELVPEVVAVMPQFEPYNFSVGRASPRAGPSEVSPQQTTMHVADARRFVRATTNRYDVIVADLFHPARDGAGSLYTVEHFRAMRARLAPDGLACQWLPLYQLDDDMLRVIVRTFLAVFPDAQAWLLQMNVDTPVVGLIGGINSRGYDSARIENRSASPALAAELKKLAMADSIRFFGCWVAGSGQLREYAGSAPLNTDDQPRVTFNAPRFAYQHNATPYGRLLKLLALESPPAAPGSGFGGKAFEERVARYRRARNAYLRGLIADAEGKHAVAVDAFVESARLSEDFTAGYAQCLTLASLKAKDNPEEAKAILRRLVEAQPARPVAREMLNRLEEK